MSRPEYKSLFIHDLRIRRCPGRRGCRTCYKLIVVGENLINKGEIQERGVKPTFVECPYCQYVDRLDLLPLSLGKFSKVPPLFSNKITMNP